MTNLEICDKLFAAVASGDVEAVRALYTPDTIVWHNFDKKGDSAEKNLALLAGMSRSVSNLRYEDIRRIETATGFVQQHVLRCTTKAGVEVDLPACMIGEIQDGHITRLDEYFDSAQAAPLFAR